MSGKQLTRLALILVVLLLIWGAAALARRRETASASGEDRFVLPRMGQAAVDTVRIQRKGDTTVLVRADSARWKVNGYPASSTAIGELFDALADTASAAELVAERPGSHAGLGVDSAGGAQVRFIGKGKVLADLIAGRRSPDMEGGFIRRAGQNETFLVRGRLSEILNRSSDDWRDHRIAAVPSDSVQAIEITRGKRNYTLRRATAGWKFGSGGATDSAAVAALVGAYGHVDAAGFASPAQADSARFNRPDRRARLLRADGTPLLTLLFDSTAGGFWLRPDSGKTVYRVESWTADRLTPPDSTLRPTKPPASTKQPSRTSPQNKQ